MAQDVPLKRPIRWEVRIQLDEFCLLAPDHQ
jgi:hypothetical protein